MLKQVLQGMVVGIANIITWCERRYDDGLPWAL